MLSPLRNRFGIPGVISVVALVFAMLGGAYAASNSSDGGATASAKAKRGPKGPKGATGPAGPAGPAGPQGPAGANGKDGSNGSNGATGAAGTSGKNVVTGTLNPGQGGCVEGGAYVEVSGEAATKKSVCNGEAGAQGNAGSPWTAGGTLPVGATETGAWGFTRSLETFNGNAMADISFAIPLAASLDENHVHLFSDTNFADFDGAGAGTVGCTGSIGNPTAPSGHLCVYGEKVGGVEVSIAEPPFGGTGATRAGTLLRALFLFTPEEEFGLAGGTWAVTG